MLTSDLSMMITQIMLVSLSNQSNCLVQLGEKRKERRSQTKTIKVGKPKKEIERSEKALEQVVIKSFW